MDVSTADSNRKRQITNEFLPEPYLSKLSIFRLAPVHEVLVTYQGGYQEPHVTLILQQQVRPSTIEDRGKSLHG